MLRSIQVVNHAGIVGSTKDTTHTGRPATLVRASRRTSVALLQLGCGTASAGIWELRVHGPLGLIRSHRRSPITTAEAPRRMSYDIRFGAANLHVVTMPFLGFERRDSV